MEESGVVSRMTSAEKISGVSRARGFPAPMARTAARAEAAERATTAPMRQPRRQSSFPSARPTRPAPMMERVLAREEDIEMIE